MSDAVKSTFVQAASYVRGRVRALVSYSLAFKAINIILLAPVTAMILQLFISRSGRAAFGNFEIAQFLLSPIGLLSLIVVGAISLATLYLEIAGLMRLMADRHLAWWQVGSSSIGLARPLVTLGVMQLVMTLLIAAPFLLAIGSIYIALWSGRDLNGLIVLKPPEFWWGAGLAGLLACLFTVLIAIVYLYWLLALPTLMFGRSITPRKALRISRQRTGQHRLLILGSIATWAAAQLGIAATCFGLAQFLSLKVLAIEWQSLSAAALATGAVLVGQWLLSGLLSIIANIGFAAIVYALYRHAVAEEYVPGSSTEIDSTLDARHRPLPAPYNEAEPKSHRTYSLGSLLAAAVIACLGVALAASFWVCDALRLREPIEITAHRAGATHAPENTVAAIKRAIEDRADWAEIDVQLTADQALVVMHDTDLARVGGGSTQVGGATLADIQRLDVGTLFKPEFAGERIPTFNQILEAAHSKIRLNVELKPHGASDTTELTTRVVAAIQEADMVSECRICSQSYESILLAKQLEPRIEIGFIVATMIGDVTQSKVDYLMISSQHAQRRLVDRAHVRGIRIHAWTINDAKLVPPLLDAGVDNLITDDPTMVAQELRELADLHPIERILVRTRHALLGN